MLRWGGLALAGVLLGSCFGEPEGEPSAPPAPDREARAGDAAEGPDPEALLAALEDPVREGGVYRLVCAACHGDRGEGKEELFSPSIAGMPEWYTLAQFQKYRAGWRGTHPEDFPGVQMRAIALALSTEQIETVAHEIAAMEPFPTEPPPEDLELTPGRRIYARECMACHRFNGTGEIAFNSAPLIHLNRSYLKRQMHNYRKGRRGATPGDLYGHKMVDVTNRMSDEEIEAVVLYIGALAHGDDPRIEMER